MFYSIGLTSPMGKLGLETNEELRAFWSKTFGSNTIWSTGKVDNETLWAK